MTAVFCWFMNSQSFSCEGYAGHRDVCVQLKWRSVAGFFFWPLTKYHIKLHFSIDCVMPRTMPAGKFTNHFPVPVNVYLFIKPLVSVICCFIFPGVKLEVDPETHTHSHMLKIIECDYHWAILDNHFLTCTRWHCWLKWDITTASPGAEWEWQSVQHCS